MLEMRKTYLGEKVSAETNGSIQVLMMKKRIAVSSAGSWSSM
jgi:hypothetical protein